MQLQEAYKQILQRFPDMKIIIVTGAILILAASALILRMGSYNYPSENKSDNADLVDPDQAE